MFPVRAAPRVAFFTDCFYEVNGVALTSRELDRFAHERGLPFFSLHVGPKTTVRRDGEHTTMELKRSPVCMPLDAGMSFDILALRHLTRVRRALTAFQPDLVHITGPGDCGLLGALLAWQIGVPIVASWHTNLHEFGARRLERVLGAAAPKRWAAAVGAVSERGMLRALKAFYGSGSVLLAPNPELIAMLESGTGRPAFLMRRGVDTKLFSPEQRDRKDNLFTIGYVGRLSPEKNVRLLAEIEHELVAQGFDRFRILIVGQGSQREWLQANVQRAEFTGVLKGEALARAYANMDVFAFPSDTDTFGNVVLEALASGAPAVVTAGGGPKFLIEDGVTGFVATGKAAFV
ncbi:MAG: glycosyltransferase, partial [Acidobacteriota bacterium]|nr:glycosyltransferase [Acidobacteriota bacterium]